MSIKMPFLILLIIGVFYSSYVGRLHAQLIEPTRSLQGGTEETGILRVVSEPPGMEVRVDGKVIGKTPIFSSKFPAGVHVLRIDNSETEIHLAAGKTTAMSSFKGSLIEIPETAGRPSETMKETQPSEKAPSRQEGKTGVEQIYENRPYYWPMNPRGPIY